MTTFPTLRQLRARAARPVVSTLTASAALQLLGLLTSVLLARELGPTGRGELAAAILWPQVIVGFGSLGIIDSVTYHAARRTAPLRVLLSTSAALALAQGALLLGVGLLIVPLVLAQYEPSVVDACRLFLATIPITLVSLYLMSILNGSHRYGWFNLLRVLVIAAGAAGLVGLTISGQLTVTTAVLAYIAAQVITTVVATGATVPVAGGFGRASRELTGKILSFGWRSLLSTISNRFNERLDQMVISIFLAPSALGLYVVALTMSVVVNLIGWSLTFVALPTVAGAESEASRVAAAARYVRLTFLGSISVAALLFIAAPTLIEFAFGDQFRGTTDVARILLGASVFLSTGRVLEAVLKGVNRPLDASLAEGVGLALTIIGLAALLPLLGIEGAAITSLVAYSVVAAISLRRVNAALGTKGLALLR